MWFPFSKKSSDLRSLFPYRVHLNHPEAQELFFKHLKVFLHRVYEENPSYQRRSAYSKELSQGSGNHLIILCIGTDRSTGDSLGPLIGSKLTAACLPRIKVFGTLDNPIHAVNLETTLKKINIEDSNTPIIAIDACLGKSENIGCISIKPGPLQPGTGVNKTLPEVGNFHIIGVVNVGGFMEYLVLQNTRLSLVMKMSELISNGLLQAIKDFYYTSHTTLLYNENKNEFTHTHAHTHTTPTPVYGEDSLGIKEGGCP